MHLTKFNDIYCLVDDESHFYIVACNAQIDLKVSSKKEWEEFCETIQNSSDYFFGYFSYELKNIFENLCSENEKLIDCPLAHFKSFENVRISRKGAIIFESGDKKKLNDLEAQLFSQSVKKTLNHKFIPGIDKQTYLNSIEIIQNHIQLGDIYEANFCYPFKAHATDFDSLNYFRSLRENNPAPFSAFLKFDNIEVVCSSPERFIKKSNNKIVSQPIKGTIARSSSAFYDEILKNALKTNQKDRSENVMIVDLVRNDLSRFAKPSSVKTTELCEIYSFPTLHQMISTVECEVGENVTLDQIISSTFPMGSMTGAPKISAMKIIEEQECFQREIYSGSIGYITPNNDFDFNVVIRSLIRNTETGNMMIPVGGAITSNSNPESEYQETLLKAKALLDIFKND